MEQSTASGTRYKHTKYSRSSSTPDGNNIFPRLRRQSRSNRNEISVAVGPNPNPIPGCSRTVLGYIRFDFRRIPERLIPFRDFMELHRGLLRPVRRTREVTFDGIPTSSAVYKVRFSGIRLPIPANIVSVHWEIKMKVYGRPHWIDTFREFVFIGNFSKEMKLEKVRDLLTMFWSIRKSPVVFLQSGIIDNNWKIFQSSDSSNTSN